MYYACAGFHRRLEFDEQSSLTESSSASKKKGLRRSTQAEEASHVGESGEEKTVLTDIEQTAVISRKKKTSKHSGSCRNS